MTLITLKCNMLIITHYTHPVHTRYLVTPKGTIYVTDVPKNTPNFDQLFLAGKRLIRAKYPNGDPEDFDETNSLAGWARTDGSVAWKQRVITLITLVILTAPQWPLNSLL